jgi:hypothetical protein
MKLSARDSAAPEWRDVLAAAKRHHAARRFHQCFILCQEFLSTVKPQMNVEPAYLIYLNFYAAVALEAQARDLAHPSTRRKLLLLQAREHYRSAASLVADEDAARTRPEHRRASSSSVPPGLHSPVSSVSSRSTISSPPSRAASPDPPVLASRRLPSKRKNHIAFCADFVVEPVIRPDSPTLGFDDWPGDPAPDAAPEPLLKMTWPTPPPPPQAPSCFSVSSSPDSAPLAPIVEEEEPIEEELADPFALARSVHRYCTILSDLHRQIASHLASIDADLSSSNIHPRPLSENEQHRALDIKARIERLRANGWQRPRFEPQKYQRLREAALTDLTS